MTIAAEGGKADIAKPMHGLGSGTGIAAADFSRIRNADLGRFTVDQLMGIINKLGSSVEVKVRVLPDCLKAQPKGQPAR